MISLKQLHYALAVAKARHFRKAADACAVSQSALSTAVAELESQLDVQIFERDSKRVLVTPAGERILRKARAIRTEVDDLYRIAKADSGPLSYPMTLGVIPTIGPYLLPKVLPDLRRRYPDFQLTIVEAQSQALADQVRDGELDTAILALPFGTEHLHAFEFWAENLYFVTHRDSSYAQLPAIDSEQLHDEPLLLLSDGHCLRDHARSVCQLRSTDMRRALAGTSLYTLIQMVAGQLGSTLVPEMALEPLLANSSELVAVELNEPSPHRTIAFVTRLNYARVADIELLMKLFRRALREAAGGRRA